MDTTISAINSIESQVAEGGLEADGSMEVRDGGDEDGDISVVR